MKKCQRLKFKKKTAKRDENKLRQGRPKSDAKAGYKIDSETKNFQRPQKPS